MGARGWGGHGESVIHGTELQFQKVENSGGDAGDGPAM